MRACQRCGAEVEKDDRYCPECGIKIEYVKETRKITVGSFFKIIGAISLLIIFVSILKNKPQGATVLQLLIILPLLIYACISFLNWLLKKVFNTELSAGVKILFVVIVVVIFLFMMTRVSQPLKAYPSYAKPVETNEVYSFVEKLNQIMRHKDYSSLKALLENGFITKEVFDDIAGLLGESEEFDITLQPQEQSFYGDKVQLSAVMMVRAGNTQRAAGVTLFFNRTGRGMALVVIEPRLSDVKLYKSFEEETEFKLKKIPSLSENI